MLGTRKCRSQRAQAVLLCAALAAIVAGCQGQEDTSAQANGKVYGEILPGAASDEMIATGALTSRAPLAPRKDTGDNTPSGSAADGEEAIATSAPEDAGAQDNGPANAAEPSQAPANPDEAGN